MHRPTDRPTDHQGNCPSCAATGKVSTSSLGGFFDDLSKRLRNVRIVCGDWSRVLGPSVTTRHGVTAILLDPPYAGSEHEIRYSAATRDVSADVRAWAIASGDNADLRIALCGYEGEHAMPESWECVEWKAVGGYGSQGDGRGRENAARERIWFSPHCLGDTQPSLFYQPMSRTEWETGKLGEERA